MKTFFIGILTFLMCWTMPAYSFANLETLPIEPTSQLNINSANPVQPTHSKKAIRQQLKAQKKALRQQSNQAQAADSMLILAIIFAILIPCVGVLIHQGSLTIDFWITLLLMFLFWLPGIIYALYVILAKG